MKTPDIHIRDPYVLPLPSEGRYLLFGTTGKYVFTNTADFKRLLLTMMGESKVALRLHSLLVDVIRDGDHLLGVVLESKSGRQIVPARQFIDATGDGDLAFRADAPYTVGVTADDLCAATSKAGDMTFMGVMFKLANVDLQRTFVWLKEHPRTVSASGRTRSIPISGRRG